MHLRLLATALAAAAVAGSAAPAQAAAPANDHFANAATIPAAGGSAAYDTEDATLQAGEPSTEGDGHTVWYRWKPSQTGFTQLRGPVWYKRVYTGTTLANLVPVTVKTDQQHYWFTFKANANQQYYVRIDDRDFYGEVDPIDGVLEIEQDLVAPQTTIVNPPSVVAPKAGGFTFSSSEAGSKFLCTLDGEPIPCHKFTGELGVPVSDLPGGTRLLTVAAVDPFGNTDPTPAKHVFEVDGTPPETTITSTPPTVENDLTSEVTFSFVANEPGSTFQCRANHDASFSACTSPLTRVMKNGPVSLTVRAIDPRGNVEQTPAVVAWTRDLAESQRLQMQRWTGRPTGGGTPDMGGTVAPPPPAPPVGNPRLTGGPACVAGARPASFVTRRGLVRRGMTLLVDVSGIACPARVRVMLGRARLFERTISLTPGRTSRVRVRLTKAGRRAVLRRSARRTPVVLEAITSAGARRASPVRLR